MLVQYVSNMKTRYVIILALIGVFTMLYIQNVYAIPYMSPQDLYKQSDMVFHGQVISKQAGPGPDYYYYQIKADTFFKNPQTSDSVTVAGHKPADGRIQYPQFEIGDKAIFYTSKVDGINTIGLFSQKAGMACDAQSFLGSTYMPSNAQSFSAVASNPRITDINGNVVVGKVQRGQPIQITYDEIWNNYPEYRAILLHMSIQNMVDTKPSFEENRTIFLNACDGPSPAKLNFVPEKNGTYIFNLNIDGKLATSTSFHVSDSSYSDTVMTQSPLKQFKSGITTQNIVCKDGFMLAIKKQGHQPACVDSDTASKLVLRGWSENPLDSLFLKYGNQTQANLVFYDIMNEPKIRDWSMKGWRYSDYSYASNGETGQSSATIHLYLPSNIGQHKCENGSYGSVVVNLKPIEIEHNYTEVGCEIATTTVTRVDPESNGR